METQLKQSCENLLAKAKAAGADQADIILSKGKSFSLSVQDGDIDKYKVSGSQVIGVRAIKDSKIGLAYSEDLQDSSLDFIAKQAVENAENSEVNDFESIAITEGEFHYPSEYQPDNTSIEEKIEFAKKLESEVKKRNSKVTSTPYNGLSEVESAFYYLNSNGVSGFRSDYYQTCHTSALIQDNDKSSTHHVGSIGRKLKDLDLDYCVDHSIEHALNWLDATALKTGHYDVIFTIDMFGDLLSCFSNIFSGKGAMEKVNPFADRLNQQVASEKITITDIPQYADTFSKSYFDSEGVQRKDLVLIENGRLNSFYHNTVTAKFFKTTTTGHGSRGAKSALGVGGTTKVVSGGELSDSDITSGEYFEIHSMQGLHSGSNAISGDFSFAASGYLCKDGKRERPIKGVTVSGNFHKLLIETNLVGKDIKASEHNEFFAPLIRFEKMSVAGV